MELILIRGLPGSGKSTLAKRLVDGIYQGAAHLEADQYFMEDGEYNFDASRLSHAHQWCQDECRKALSLASVIVSNTFTTVRELKPYFEIAREYGIVPQVITCHGQWTSVHGVPAETMIKMRQRFVYDISWLYKNTDDDDYDERRRL